MNLEGCTLQATCLMRFLGEPPVQGRTLLGDALAAVHSIPASRTVLPSKKKKHHYQLHVPFGKRPTHAG